MHLIQKQILALSRNVNLGEKSLREIAKLIGQSHPEKIRHHIKQLEKKGFLLVDRNSNSVRNINRDLAKENLFINVPIVGTANCGPAEILAEENIMDHLKMSKRILSRSDCEYFAIKAQGESMNKADIRGRNISTGDTVVFSNRPEPIQEGDIVLAVVDGAATIKSIHFDNKHEEVHLKPLSSQKFSPIIVHQLDFEDIQINGKAEYVVKK